MAAYPGSITAVTSSSTAPDPIAAGSASTSGTAGGTDSPSPSSPLESLPGPKTTWAQFQAAFDDEHRGEQEEGRPRPSESRLRLLYRVRIVLCTGNAPPPLESHTGV